MSNDMKTHSWHALAIAASLTVALATPVWAQTPVGTEAPDYKMTTPIPHQITTPDKVTILDVRTPEEYLYVGHPAMAWKIPVAAQTYEWDAAKGQFPMERLRNGWKNSGCPWTYELTTDRMLLPKAP